MNEPEVMEKKDTIATDGSSPEKEMEDVCRGLWRLKPDIVLRVEEDGAILFDPDTDALSVVNATGSALLQWRRDRICLDEWCEALHTHYHREIDPVRVQGDMKDFLKGISHFMEVCDGQGNS
jgi:hypothetical protein